MSTIFKTLANNDVISARSLLHEAIPITGSVVSGTYSGNNVKTYSHQMFQSIFDFPYLSSSANHMFDITVGLASDSALSSTTNTDIAKKIQIYNQMAQVLVGHDVTGTILKFDQDGNIADGGTKLNEVIFINFARLLYKDEIKKGSFSLALGVNQSYSNPFTARLTLTDAGAQNDFRVNSPVGEYGILSASSGGGYSGSANSGTLGLIFYQAGIAVLTASVFAGLSDGGPIGLDAFMDPSNRTIRQILTASAIAPTTFLTQPGIADGVAHRIFDLSFNNTTELNSTIYVIRLDANEFNYSSNPTYVDGSKIRVKNNSLDIPVAYITKIGLYSSDNELLAAASVSEPLKKDPTQPLLLKVRLDYIFAFITLAASMYAMFGQYFDKLIL